MAQNSVRRLVQLPSGSKSGKSKNTMQRFASVGDAVAALRPAQPMHCWHPDALAANAAAFLTQFPGTAFYAIKSNPDVYVLRHLHEAGINNFEVASLNEVKLIRGSFPAARIAFMHPVKGREAIRAAYFDYGVRAFALDTMDELRKILAETDNATDLTLVVRLSRPAGTAACPLADKFGASATDGIALLRAARAVAPKVGLSFHVGSQTLDPSSYAEAIRAGGAVIAAAGVAVGVFNVGGGFPVPGMGMAVLPLQAFFDVIRNEIAALKLPADCETWCEPGRALCATGETLVVRVELRKGDVLHINDGSFGSMSEIALSKWRNETMRFSVADKEDTAAQGFRLYGPTCDSVDYMPGPFQLPADIAEGEWIAMRSMGAYMAASQSHFNGFYSDLQVEIKPESTLVPLRRAGKAGGRA